MTQGLSFGGFVANGGGSITVPPLGARSQTGTVALITSRGTFSAAQFSISGGPPGAAFSLRFSEDNFYSLKSGGASMPLKNFVSSLGPNPTLRPDGSQQFSVGATVVVPPNQPVGDYSATFNVTVQFN